MSQPRSITQGRRAMCAVQGRLDEGFDMSPITRRAMIAASATLLLTMGTPAAAAHFVFAHSNLNGHQENDGGFDGATTAAVELRYSQNGLFSYSSSSVDLSQGALRAKTETNFAGGASAHFGDSLTFDLPDGLQSADITVTWTVEGDVNMISGVENGIGARVQIAGLNADVVQFNELNFQRNTPKYQEFVSNGFHRFTFSDQLTVHDGEVFGVDMFLSVGIHGEGSADFGNTAFLNFAMPESVTFRSDSGVFLSDPIGGGVPEPSAWALMILGLGGAGAMLRRAKRAALTAV